LLHFDRYFELTSGKFRWRLGIDPDNDKQKKDNFADSHFLGVPVTIGDRLYALNEKYKNEKGGKGEGELRLVCIDSKKMDGEHRPKALHQLQRVNCQGFIPADQTNILLVW